MTRWFYNCLCFVSMSFGVSTLLTPDAFACSFGTLPPKMMSELTDESRYVIRGEVLYIDKSDIVDNSINRMARFKPIDFLKDTLEKPKHIDAYYLFDMSSCGRPTHFQTGEIYTVFLKADETGLLHVTQSSGEWSGYRFVYNTEQVLDYFKDGKDTALFDPECFMTIKRAYDEHVFTGGFSVQDKHCEAAKSYYDRNYK